VLGLERSVVAAELASSAVPRPDRCALALGAGRELPASFARPVGACRPSSRDFVAFLLRA
jgi:hypothetical protein